MKLLGLPFYQLPSLTWRLAKPKILFCLFVAILAGIIAFFVTKIILHLAQISIILLFIISDNCSITANCVSIRGMTLLVFSLWIKNLLRKLNQNLTKLVSISIIVINGKRLLVFLNLEVFLVPRFVIFHSFMPVTAVRIFFLH